MPQPPNLTAPQRPTSASSLRAWLRAQQGTLDALIAQVCDEAVAKWGDGAAWKPVLADLTELSGGGDCAYDRKGTGLVYASWYHPRRTLQVLQSLLPAWEQGERCNRLVDLGTGTGAAMWALGLLAAGQHAVAGEAPARVLLRGYEISPYMRGMCERLWAGLVATYPVLAAWEFQVLPDSWRRIPTLDAGGTWLVTNYLFDASEVAGIAGQELAEAVLGCQPDRVFAMTADNKWPLLQTMDRHLRTGIKAAPGRKEVLGLRRADEDAEVARLWEGPCTALFAARLRWAEYVPADQRWLFRNAPLWTPEEWPRRLSWIRPQQRLDLAQHETVTAPSHRVRLDAARWVTLEPEQAAVVEAARGTLRMRLQGQAGSGKTITLMAAVVDWAQRQTKPHAHAILSTYNHALMKWIFESVGRTLQHFGWVVGPVHAVCGKLHSVLATAPEDVDGKPRTIRITQVRPMNFDALVAVPMPGPGPAGRIEELVAQQPALRGLAERQGWVKTELQAVIAGQALVEDSYVQLSGKWVRAGRGKTPRLTHAQRRALYTVHQKLIDGLPMRCIAEYRPVWTLSQLVEGRRHVEFPLADALFVDEVQDLTLVELRVLRQLLGPAAQAAWILAGDPGQSVRNGGLHGRVFSHQSGGPTPKRTLSRAYRTCFRVARLLGDLRPVGGAEDGELVGIWNGGPPGPRPLVISQRDVAAGHLWVEDLRRYGCRTVLLHTLDAGDKWSTWARRRPAGTRPRWVEEARSRWTAAVGADDAVSINTVHRVKGLEYDAVFWDLAGHDEDEASLLPMAYAIASRACLVLVLVVPDARQPVPDPNAAALARLVHRIHGQDVADHQTHPRLRFARQSLRARWQAWVEEGRMLDAHEAVAQDDDDEAGDDAG